MQQPKKTSLTYDTITQNEKYIKNFSNKDS